MSKTDGTKFTVDLGTIVLPDAEAKRLEAAINRVVLDALAGLDLLPRRPPPQLSPDGTPMAADDLGLMFGLPPGSIYGLLVDDSLGTPPPPPHVLDIDENPF